MQPKHFGSNAWSWSWEQEGAGNSIQLLAQWGPQQEQPPREVRASCPCSGLRLGPGYFQPPGTEACDPVAKATGALCLPVEERSFVQGHLGSVAELRYRTVFLSLFPSTHLCGHSRLPSSRTPSIPSVPGTPQGTLLCGPEEHPALWA